MSDQQIDDDLALDPNVDILIGYSRRKEAHLRRCLRRWKRDPQVLQAQAIVAVAKEHGMTQELYEALIRDLPPDQLDRRMQRGSTPAQVDAAARLIVTRVNQSIAMEQLCQLSFEFKGARIRGESVDVLAELEQAVEAASVREARLQEKVERLCDEYQRTLRQGSTPELGE